MVRKFYLPNGLVYEHFQTVRCLILKRLPKRDSYDFPAHRAWYMYEAVLVEEDLPVTFTTPKRAQPGQSLAATVMGVSDAGVLSLYPELSWYRQQQRLAKDKDE
jgi:hypothetical protein